MTNFLTKFCHLVEIKNMVAEILGKLENGIRLGALTSKGFGLVTDKNATEKISPAKNISADTKNFILPGTSLKGIFRHRAEYIFSRLNLESKILDKLMGNAEGDEKIKSRFKVSESYIENKNVAEFPHTRNKIDRFTGGTLQDALFKTKPVYQKIDAPNLKVHFEINGTKNFEAGPALFLLRDLWLGKIAIGGEKCIGRGTVIGIAAEINFNGAT